MEATALELSRRTSHAVDVGRRRAALADGGLGEEQRLAFGHATRSRDLAVVVGYAGTGKSTMLGAAREAWEAEGYVVRGAALSGIAAEGLEAGSGIASRTIASWEHAWARGREMLGPRDVLVLDEAGMVGSRQMDGVLTAVRQAGAKLVLVGDQEQLQAIEAGAAFRAIAERVGAAEITEVRRQRAVWQRDATRELATGRTGEALARYQAGGMSHAHATDEAARAALIAGWQAARERAPQESQVILAHTRDDVRALNDQARSLRRAAGELGEDRVLPTELGPRAFAAGDRIYFLRNERGLGATGGASEARGPGSPGGSGGSGGAGRAGGTAVKNGSLGTILSIEGEGEGARLSVRLDRDDRADGKARVVTFGLAEYAHLDHGYAATVHKAQGATVDRAHVLATPGMDRHLAYVALSRHRHAVALHWSEESFGSAAELAARLGRERAKDTTLDYGQSAPELAAAFAARRGLDPLRPASEIAVREDGPQPFTARGRARRARLAPALLSAMSTLGEAAELQAEAAERLGRLAADRKPAAEPPAQYLYADADLGVFERILAARSLRESVIGDRPARPDREQLSQAEIFTEFTPMLDAAYQPPSEPMLPAVPYRPVEDEEVAAAVDADKNVRSAREDLGSALGRVYRDPVKAGHRLLALEAEGGAKAAAERLLKRPALLGRLHKQGGLFGGGRTAAFVIATLNAPSIGPRLVELREAEARVGYAYRTETEIRRRREAHAVPALSERARADIDALARAGAAPGNLGLAFWEGREPTAAEIRDAALLAPVWAAVTRDARVGAELTRFMDAAHRRLGPEPAASPSDAETAARRLAGVIRSGQSLADKHPVFEAYAAAEPQRRAAAQAAREAEQRAAERAAEEARAKAAEKAETDLRYREFLRGRRSAPSSGPGMG